LNLDLHQKGGIIAAFFRFGRAGRTAASWDTASTFVPDRDEPNRERQT